MSVCTPDPSSAEICFPHLFEQGIEQTQSFVGKASGRRERTLYVVDPRATQYSDVLDQLLEQGIQVRTCPTAADVLRLPATPETTCVVNEQLPDLPGIQLCERLRATGARVILTGNHRDPELSPAGQASAEVPYVGKRLLPMWLAQCLVL